MPSDFTVFDTAIGTETIQFGYPDITDVGGVFELKSRTISAYIYCVPGFACHWRLMGGMPGDTAVFHTAIVTETKQFYYPEITDVGGVFELKGCTISAYVYCTPGFA
jgi:hypothetical protein